MVKNSIKTDVQNREFIYEIMEIMKEGKKEKEEKYMRRLSEQKRENDEWEEKMKQIVNKTKHAILKAAKAGKDTEYIDDYKTYNEGTIVVMRMLEMQLGAGFRVYHDADVRHESKWCWKVTWRE